MTCPDHQFRLELLPKGSTCKSYTDVPARSSYWRDETDTVRRCARFKGERDQQGGESADGDSGDSDASEDYDTPPKEVNGWIRGANQTFESGQPKQVTYEAVTTAGAPATVPRDETVTAVVSILSHGGRFKFRYSARVKYTWREGTEDKSKTSQLSTARGSGKPVENWNRVLGKTVEWMEEHDPKKGREATADDVGGWEKVGDLEWKAEYSDPMLGGKVEHRVRIITDEDNRGDTYHLIQQKGPRHDEWKRLTAEESKDGAIEEATRWMDSHPPSHFEYEIPAEVNGWERVEKDDDAIAYETWVAPTLGRPRAVKRRIRAFRGKKGKWHHRGAYLDADGEQVSSYDPDQFRTSSSSMTGRSRGSTKTLSNPRRAMSVLKDVMEDVDPERVEYTDLPRFDVRFENGTTKPLMKVLERYAVEEPSGNRTRHAVGTVAKDGAFDIKGTDAANVALYDLSLLFSAAESASIKREGDPFAFDGVAFAEPFTDANMGADARIYTEYPDEQNVLPNLVVEVDGAERRVYMHPNAEPATAEIPDLPVGATFTVPEANPFKKGARFAQQVNDHAAIVVTENEAYMVAEGDGERRRANLTDSTNLKTDEDRLFGFYSLDYLRGFSTDVPRPSSTELTFQLTNPDGFEDVAGPMFFSWDSRGAMVTLLLAPRIKGRDDDSDDPTGGWDLSAPVCLSSTGPKIPRREISVSTYATLSRAWRLYQTAIGKGEDEKARELAAIINGVRVQCGHEPHRFVRLDGFDGVAEF